jgi:hypothetical protein
MALPLAYPVALSARASARGAGVPPRAPAAAPAVALPRRAGRRGGSAIVCIAAGFDADGYSGYDDADAALRAGRAAQPPPAVARRAASGSADSDAANDAANDAMHHRYVDGGLQRDAPLPLPLTHKFDRFPEGNAVRRFCRGQLLAPAHR